MKALALLCMGAFVGNVGLTGLEGAPDPLAEEEAVEYVMSPATQARLAALPDQEIADGIRNIDSASRKLPGYAGKFAEKVRDHGIIAFVEDDPEMTEAGHAIGVEMGTGIRFLANAVARDMVKPKPKQRG
jgi:hypothetical protein